MLQNALHSSQGLDHVCAVVVEIPQLAIMTLVGPPEGILLENLGGERGEEREKREGRRGRRERGGEGGASAGSNTRVSHNTCTG